MLIIGNFDGVHIAHQALLRAARQIAAPARARVTALCFHPHPLTILNPAGAPALLSDFPRREGLLRAAGADEVVRLEPTPELLAQSPSDFVASLIERYAPLAIVEGPDFRFGRARAGDINTLRALGAQHNFSVRIIDPVEVALTDHTFVSASSTMARWLISRGRVADAARILTRPHALSGLVERGERLGRTLGFPTANITPHELLPADGVYAAFADLPNGQTLPAALSIGSKPTFNGAVRFTEAFILNPASSGAPWSPLEGLPEYHWPLTLRVVAWIREQLRFHDIPSLVAQIERDCDRVHDLLSSSSILEPARS